MKRALMVVTVLVMGAAFLSAQEQIFTEDFESGSPSIEWGTFWVDEDQIQAVPLSSAPATLAGGGNYVGLLTDADASYTGSALAIAGDINAANYTIEGDVYCYTYHDSGSAYTGLVVALMLFLFDRLYGFVPTYMITVEFPAIFLLAMLVWFLFSVVPSIYYLFA